MQCELFFHQVISSTSEISPAPGDDCTVASPLWFASDTDGKLLIGAHLGYRCLLHPQVVAELDSLEAKHLVVRPMRIA